MKIPKTNTTGPLRRALLLLGALGSGLALVSPHARASILTASDAAAYDNFGFSMSVSGDSALAAAPRNSEMGTYAGAAYYYKGLFGKSGTVPQDVKLLASDGATGDSFGFSVSLSGDRALAGAYYHDGNAINDTGAAYYFKGLDGKSGTVEQDVKLLASDGAASDLFGISVSLSGDSALVAAYQDDDKASNAGSAYYFKGLDGKAVGSTVEQDVKLLASDGAYNDYFGISVSLSGDSALVAAYQDDDKGSNAGSAYYYKGLDSKTGRPSGYTGPASVTTATYQDVKLVASDGAVDDSFGFSVSLLGDSALAGAVYGDGNDVDSGAAYYYKGLDLKSGTVEQDVKLVASDGAEYDEFGQSVSLSGDSALAGAAYGDGNDVDSGAAYYYKGLDGKATGSTVEQDVKLLASDGAAGDSFGHSVRLEGDRFVIGAHCAQTYTGKAYAGDIRAFTTLDAIGTGLMTDGLSFVSQGDWVIGETTTGTAVILSRDAATGIADTANVTATGAAVYIGKNAGSHYNSLYIKGELTANAVYVGAEGNNSNMLALSTTGRVTADEVMIADYGIVVFELGAAGVNGRVAAGEIVLGDPQSSQIRLILSASDGFVAVAGAEYDLFDVTTISGAFVSVDTGQVPLVEGLEWNFDRLYTEGIVAIVETLAPPMIGSFMVDNPPAATATIDASPKSGTAPLASTITWSTGNAASVTVSGPGLDSAAASGNQAVSGLTAGSHTYTVTADTAPYAILNWSVAGDVASLTLLTPSGPVDVTGQEVNFATEPGDYTLQATNASGTVTSGPITVVLPGPASASVTITVAAPPSIDSFTPPTVKPPMVILFTATPDKGTAPLNTTINWVTGEASSVTVSGPGLSSGGASGNRAVTGLAAGSHTYTVTAQPQTSGTLTWTTSNAATLTLVTPSGPVNVTGQTSYTATQSGTYALLAANALGYTINEVRTVTLPTSAASATVTVTVLAPASIDSFTVANPAAPTATITATPDQGPAPLDSTLAWSTTNAGPVTVSGPGLSSGGPSGSHPLTGLAAGDYTYTVTAQPKPAATITWSVTGASALILDTPSGSVNVTGQTGYIATEPGTYTLRATNALMVQTTTSSPITVAWPEAASASATIKVGQPLPTIPPVIDPDTVVVIPDPTTPGGIVIGGEIGSDPADPEQAQELEEEKIFLVTTTDILGMWSVADPSTYTVTVAPDGLSFTVAIDPTTDAARFWRVATSLQPVDASGAPVAGDTVKYNTVLSGRYEVTVPGTQTRLVANQLAEGVTDAVTLFSDLAVGSSINVINPDGTSATTTRIAAGGGRWQPATMAFPVGSVATVRNAGAAASTKAFVGIVPTQSAMYSLTSGETRNVGTSLPIAATTVALGISPIVGDTVGTYRSNGLLGANTYLPTAGGRWSESNTPTTIHIGEGFQIKHNAALPWAPRLNVVEDSTDVGLE
ncbi:hypothetical protein OPIT5_17875 [Opitutaceae bacterium TAV5]|nr:hypothetical protein OPIT5_17875 [Opitutaceae bacterium TAV5]